MNNNQMIHILERINGCMLTLAKRDRNKKKRRTTKDKETQRYHMCTYEQYSQEYRYVN